MYKTKNLQINTTYQNKILEKEVKDEIERKSIAAIKALSPSQKNVDSLLKIMKEGDYFNVSPPKKHRVIA